MTLLVNRLPLPGTIAEIGPLPEPWHSKFNECVECTNDTVWGFVLTTGDVTPMCASCLRKWMPLNRGRPP